MDYCQDAKKMLGIKVICGQECPLIDKCPRLILEDLTEEAIEKAIEAMVEAVKRDETKS